MEFWQGFIIGYIVGLLAMGWLAWRVGVLKKMMDYINS